MFQNLFEQALSTRKIISLNTYGDSNIFVGFVLAYTTEQVTIEHISKYGRFDGRITLKLSDIERIDVDDDLCRSIGYLYHNQKEIDALSKKYAQMEANTGDFVAVLQECKDKNLICSVDTKEIYLTCFILDVTFDEVHFLAIDSDGMKDGECYVKMEDIGYVSCGRLAEIRRLLLYNINYRI